MFYLFYLNRKLRENRFSFTVRERREILREEASKVLKKGELGGDTMDKT